jgi:UPF0271 protein
MKEYIIDINADVGEGMGNESELFPMISSCNIACGGHAGDQQSILSTVRLAKKNNIKIGAHPSFPDKINFGRKILKIDKESLFKSLKNQIESLQNILIQENIKLNHIKPHGALYNLAANDRKTAKIIIDLVKEINVKLYVPYNSLIAEIANKQGIDICNELFIDRNYNSDLTLVSRDHPNAMIKDSESIFQHVNGIINDKTITTIDLKKIAVEFDTLCIHGDSKNVIKLTKDLHIKLNNIGIKIL